MHVKLGFIAAAAALVLGHGGAQAAQFLMTDKTYRHPDNTDNGPSHTKLPFVSGVPANWRTPENFAEGTMYARIEVKAKPSNIRTHYFICFWARSGYFCGYPVKPFTTAGVYHGQLELPRFWSYQGKDLSLVRSSFAVVKLDNNEQVTSKSDGRWNATYPLDLRVTIYMVSKGAAFQPPPGWPGQNPADGGVTMPDAAVPDGAFAGVDAGASPDMAGPDATAAGREKMDATSTSEPNPSRRPPQNPPPPADEEEPPSPRPPNGGCRYGGGGGAGGLATLLGLSLAFSRRRRR